MECVERDVLMDFYNEVQECESVPVTSTWKQFWSSWYLLGNIGGYLPSGWAGQHLQQTQGVGKQNCNFSKICLWIQ